MTVAPKKDILLEADRNRGIQNATSRFKRQRDGQTLQQQLLRGMERAPRAGEASNDPTYRRGDSRSSSVAGREVKFLRNELQQLENEDDFEYEEGDAELLIKNPPQKPDFPKVIFSIAVIKDIVDQVAWTGVGALVTTGLSFLMALVLFLWILGKASGGWWKKGFIKYLWKRWIAGTILEVFSGGIIPATTIFVLMAHYRETKVVKMLNGALERMRSGGLRGE